LKSKTGNVFKTPIRGCRDGVSGVQGNLRLPEAIEASTKFMNDCRTDGARQTQAEVRSETVGRLAEVRKVGYTGRFSPKGIEHVRHIPAEAPAKPCVLHQTMVEPE
jgi:hypothetical protein